ncbi:MAG: beta-fructofuranosidase, partial [Actinomycetota bacterium]|nr:beta-fructofuranosidase [Actinomycetota bacterium]
MTRPGLHFTVRKGWTNDPHGIVYDGARYHLFFQYNPVATVWAPAIHWGHAVSDDLVTWVEQ